MALLPPTANPCGSCPYRRDVASGIWAKEEYLKLPDYDRETGSQPTGVFMCHQQDGHVCAGWCGTHDMAESLAIRFASFANTPAAVISAIVDYKTSTPLFASGRDAARHGMRDLMDPTPRARRMVASLSRKRAIRSRQKAAK